MENTKKLHIYFFFFLIFMNTQIIYKNLFSPISLVFFLHTIKTLKMIFFFFISSATGDKKKTYPKNFFSLFSSTSNKLSKVYLFDFFCFQLHTYFLEHPKPLIQKFLNTSWSNTNQIKFIKILFHYPKTQINLLKFISSSNFSHCNTPRYFLTHQCANH